MEKALLEYGAAKVIHIEARHCIEDWFLYDADGIISYLLINRKTKISGKSGYDKLQRLYKQANKVYYKGIRSNGIRSEARACLENHLNYKYCLK